MSVLQDIAEQLKKQNDLNEQIANHLNNQNNTPDQEEQKEDAERTKIEAFKDIGKKIKALGNAIIPKLAKDAASGFFNLLKENALMAVGITAIQTLLNNWPRIQEAVTKFGEFLEGPVARIKDFFVEYTPKAMKLFDIIYEKTGLLGILAAGYVILNPIKSLINLIRATKGTILTASALFKTGKFLAGFLGPVGMAALVGAGLITAAVAYNRIEDEDELLEANEESTANYEASNEFAGLEPQPAPAPRVEETSNANPLNALAAEKALLERTGDTEGERYKNVTTKIESLQKERALNPFGGEGAPVTVNSPAPAKRVENSYTDPTTAPLKALVVEKGTLERTGDTQSPRYNEVTAKIESLQKERALDPFGGAGPEIKTQNNPNVLLEEIKTNTEITPEKQRKQAENFVTTLSERMNTLIQTGIIENSFGTDVDPIPLGIVTA